MDIKHWKKVIKYQLIKNKVKRNNPFVKERVSCESPPIIYLFYVACGTNMGDHAIVRAETEFIHRCLGDEVTIVEIQTGQTESAIDYLRKNIRKQDLIVLSGGGYIGDEYIEVYTPLKRILKEFRKNKTIVFPQTIYFSEVHREKQFSQLCKNHENLTIFVREKKSHEIFRNIGITTYLVPDIVLSQTPKEHNANEDILLCMRNDVEKNMSDSEVQKLFKILQNFGSVIVTDTVESTIFPFDQRFAYLDKMLNSFSNSRLVVTDRIHGMIFSYITNTPCLVFGNYNHKVESEYEWIKDCSNIRFVNSFHIDKIYEELSKVISCSCSKNKSLNEKFVRLEEVLKIYYEQ